MKKLLFVLFPFVCFSQENRKELNLSSNVKSVRQYYYSVDNFINDSIFKGAKAHEFGQTFQMRFDSLGNQTEHLIFDYMDENISKGKFYVYDEKGNKIEECDYYSFGYPTIQYEYDENGNLIKEVHLLQK